MVFFDKCSIIYENIYILIQSLTLSWKNYERETSFIQRQFFILKAPNQKNQYSNFQCIFFCLFVQNLQAMKEEKYKTFENKQRNKQSHKTIESRQSQRRRKNTRVSNQCEESQRSSQNYIIGENSKKSHKKIMRRIGYKPTVKAFSKIYQKNSSSRKSSRTRQNNNFVLNTKQSQHREYTQKQYLNDEEKSYFNSIQNKKKLKRIGRKVWVTAYKKTVMQSSQLQQSTNKLCQSQNFDSIQPIEKSIQTEQIHKNTFTQFKQEEILLKLDNLKNVELSRIQEISKIDEEQEQIQKSYWQKLAQQNHNIYSQKFIKQKTIKKLDTQKQITQKYITGLTDTEYDNVVQRQSFSKIDQDQGRIQDRSLSSDCLEMEEAAQISIEQENYQKNQKGKYNNESDDDEYVLSHKSSSNQDILNTEQNLIQEQLKKRKIKKLKNQNQKENQYQQNKKTFYKVMVSQPLNCNSMLGFKNTQFKNQSIQLSELSQTISREVNSAIKPIDQEQNQKQLADPNFKPTPYYLKKKFLEVKGQLLNTPSQNSEDQSCQSSSKRSQFKSECTFYNRTTQPKPSYLSENTQMKNSGNKLKKPLPPAYPFIQNILATISTDISNINTFKGSQKLKNQSGTANNQTKSPIKTPDLTQSKNKSLNKLVKINKEKLAEYQPKKMSHSTHLDTKKQNKQNIPNKSKISSSMHAQRSPGNKNNTNGLGNSGHKAPNKRYQVHKYISGARKQLKEINSFRVD